MAFIKFIDFKDFKLWDVKRYSHKNIKTRFCLVSIKEFVQKYKETVQIKDTEQYKRIRIRSYGKGVELRDIECGEEIKTKQQFSVKAGQFIFSKIDARNGAFGIVPNELDNAIITNSFSVYDVNNSIANTKYLYLVTKTKYFQELCEKVSSGTTGRRNISDEYFINFQIPLPTLSQQEKIVQNYFAKIEKAKELERKSQNLEQEIEEYFLAELGIQKQEKRERKKGLQFVEYVKLSKWSLNYITRSEKFNFLNSIYETVKLKTLLASFEGGKTPSKLNLKFWESDIFWTSPKDFHGQEVLEVSQDKISQITLQKAGMKMHPKGTILSVFRSGILKHSFPTVITGIETTINQDIKAYTLHKEKINTYYYLIFSQVCKQYILDKASKKSVTVESINTEEFLEIDIPLPPLPKQQEIVNVIQTKKEKAQNLKTQAKELKLKAETEFEQTVFINC